MPCIRPLTIMKAAEETENTAEDITALNTLLSTVFTFVIDYVEATGKTTSTTDTTDSDTTI